MHDSVLCSDVITADRSRGRREPEPSYTQLSDVFTGRRSAPGEVWSGGGDDHPHHLEATHSTPAGRGKLFFCSERISFPAQLIFL